MRGRSAWADKEIDRLGPPPGPDPVARLRHTLAVFADTPDEEWVITATRNLYDDPRHERTGLTWGDLRQLAARSLSREYPVTNDRRAG